MPKAPVDSKGAELFFTDSGAPSSSNYTTLVVFHGSGFNGRSFDKLNPIAYASNVRLILVNRRGYAGSSTYTNEELNDLKADRQVCLEGIAAEIARFLAWLIEQEGIPRVSEDGKNGGLSVMGWSMGAAAALAVLGQPNVISKEAYDRLEPSFRQVILYDPADLPLGYDFRNAPTGPDDFAHLVTRYYIHPDLSRREGSHADDTKRPSIESCTDEDMQVMFEDGPMKRVDFPLFITMRETLEEQTKRAIYDERLAKEYFPKVEVVYLDCEQTMWALRHCRQQVENRRNELMSQGRDLRPMRFVDVEGANHFVHWDLPEKFWSVAVMAIAGIY